MSEYDVISNSSDEEEKLCSKVNFPKLEGNLNKWTNYINGWQKRWVVLKDGTLTYYRSESETKFGCRGAVSLFKAFIKAHDYDDCRFDVKVNDYTLCLRASTPSERKRWLKALNTFKDCAVQLTTEAKDSEETIDQGSPEINKSLDSGYGSENSLKRGNSALSVSINTSPLTNYRSPTSCDRASSTPKLNENITELETLKESVFQQLNNLQTYLEINNDHSNGCGKEDFKGKVVTFRATASNLMERLNQCLRTINQQHESKFQYSNGEMTVNNSNHIEDMCSNVAKVVDTFAISESSEDVSQTDRAYVKTDGENRRKSNEWLNGNICDRNSGIQQPSLEIRNHRLWPEIDEITKEQVQYARMGLGKDAWQLFAEEGEMKMYKREEEQNGLAVDPLKACHFVHGFTAHEICHYFFRPEVRYEWETTLEANGMMVLETISQDGIIFHQLHKRIWPVAQRDAVFWSHMRQVPLELTDDASIHDAWVVVNHSTDMPSRPANVGKQVRIFMTVCLFCQTVVLSDKPVDKLTRKDIACKITYCSIVNPGGWAPTSALRIVYKREYPRFLRKFTAYVTNKTKEKPIMF